MDNFNEYRSYSLFKPELRLPFGKYFPDDYETVVDTKFIWLPGIMYYSEYTISEVKKITEYLKKNVDNIWEGPLHCLGYWKFRFTEEEDLLLFKLLK